MWILKEGFQVYEEKKIDRWDFKAIKPWIKLFDSVILQSTAEKIKTHTLKRRFAPRVPHTYSDIFEKGGTPSYGFRKNGVYEYDYVMHHAVHALF